MAIAPTELAGVLLLSYPPPSDRSSKYSLEQPLPPGLSGVVVGAFCFEVLSQPPFWPDVGGRHTYPTPPQSVVASANPQ